MIYRVLTFISAFLCWLPLSGQNPKLPAGYPDRDPAMDVLPGFIHPPKGYGNVPFYWWQGDTLTRERLAWQLDQLSGKGISSLQINYSHLDTGGISYGSSNPSKPALFTDDWWKLFKWFAAEARKKGMTVSLSDYTLGIGQGFSMDEAVAQNPGLNGSTLHHKISLLTGSGQLKIADNLLSLKSYRIREDSSVIPDSGQDLLPSVKNGTLFYDFGNEKKKVIAVWSEVLLPSYNPMHPQSGNAYNQHFFEKFEKALKDKEGGALNFFFSDELNFRVNGNLWDNNFAAEFRKRKGYDVVPFLDALFVDIGPLTPKIRLDYNDVLVKLSEENFFEPVFRWHQERGMIFGCDHGGRGKDVAEFGDYFRTQRWNQGPGSDQPNLSKDIIKAKVASSISHLYERPRVWLEGFYGSGWGTTSSDITDAIFGNFVAGYNLLSLHGLYYSTQGGWWEWAPPCNHFRMPYWKQIDPLMHCVERLSYLLSQGVHRCDVAILYPSEPVVAGMEGEKSVAAAFKTGELLYDKGTDFDFIDFESLARAEIRNKELVVSGERYKVLVVPSMKAIRHASLQKLEAFKKEGGILVNIGDIPVATEKNGTNDAETMKLVDAIFSKAPNLIQCRKPEEVHAALSGKYSPGFEVLSPLKGRPYVMHRVIGRRELFALYNLEAGTRCFFRTKGKAQLWNPWNGEVASLAEFATAGSEGTELSLPLSGKEIQLIVFDTEESPVAGVLRQEKMIGERDLGSSWEFELNPSLDNRWGDFQLPATKGLMGAQARQLYFSESFRMEGGMISLDSAWKKVTCGFGKQFMQLGPLPELPAADGLLKIIPRRESDEVTVSGRKQQWKTYGFSWKLGVEDDPGHQGYHGLKGRMYDNFIRLGAVKEVKHSKQRVPDSAGSYYLLYSNIIAPADGKYDLLTGEVKPHLLFINNTMTDPGKSSVGLKKGPNPVLAVYDKACETFLVFRKPGVPMPERQQVAMRWYGDTGVLPFDASSENCPSGLFAFQSAPGLKSLSFSACGQLTAWIDGVQAEIGSGQVQPYGGKMYTLELKKPAITGSQVVFKIDYQPGYCGGAAFPQFIEQRCGTGTIHLGDWSEIDGLRAYSGGAWYRKNILLDTSEVRNRLEIDLGDLVSSAELLINGKSAGIRVSPPWKYDITPFATPGENRIEILVCNTIANNYTTVPTNYRGSVRSGLMGPVYLRIMKQAR